MKTKTIFKTLALAMMMPAMLLTTACSSDDDSIINNENINKQNTAKKGYALPVTVNVTRQGDAATRASFDGSKLNFSAGDKLFVYGSTTAAGSFAGELDYVPASENFSGTIYTENQYTGTADALFTAASAGENLTATLLPNGYDANGSNSFLSINNNSTTDIAYDDRLTVSGSYAFVASETAKATGVEQLSLEQASTYSSAFALSPGNAILNFTITGLEAGAKDVLLHIHHGFDYDVFGSVTPNASGVATFAMGVPGGSNIKDMGNNLTVGSHNFTLPSSTTFAAGKIYNINRSVAPAGPTAYTLTASTVGMIVGSDGKAYAVEDKDNLPSGVTAVAMVAYLGSASDCTNGLAIALENVGNGNTWDSAAGLCNAWNESTSPKKVTGGTWRLPTIIDWQNIIIGCGTSGTAVADPRNTKMECYGLLKKLSDAGGVTLTSWYWSSTEVNANYAMDLNFTGGSDGALFSHASKTGQCAVRACLAF